MSRVVVVLAGGTSRRFGTDKLSTPVDGATLLETALAALPVTLDVVVVGPPRPTGRAVRFVREDPAGGGPAAAMVTGLAAALETAPELLAVLPADAPASGEAAVELLARLDADPTAEALVGCDEDGRWQPLQLALRPGAAARLVAGATDGGQGASARRLVAGLRPQPRAVRLARDRLFDIDTPDQLAAWEARRSAAVVAVLDLLQRHRRADGGPVVLALEGSARSRTSTLAAALALRTPAVVLPVQDFVLPASTDADRLDGGVDWVRLREEVLGPLVDGRPARYRPRTWEGGRASSRLDPERVLTPAPVVVLTGRLAGAPELSDLVTATVLLRGPTGPELGPPGPGEEERPTGYDLVLGPELDVGSST